MRYKNLNITYKDLNIANFSCNGKCSNCGQCCGDILHLSKQEIKRIDNYLKNHKIEATPRNTIFEYDNTCPFRDNANMKCKIYEVRPDICRVYQCNIAPEEAYKNKEITLMLFGKENGGKLLRSMRNLFFNDTKGATFVKNTLYMPIFDRNDKVIDDSTN